MFSFDTSGFIGCWSRYYPPSTFSTLWDRIEGQIASGNLIASKSVLDEIERQDDDLCAWTKDHNNLFIEDDEQIQARVKRFYSEYPAKYKVDWTKRLLGADLFVMAHAVEADLYVVTDEKRHKNYEAPRIPDACHILGVKCLSPLEFIQKCGWTF